MNPSASPDPVAAQSAAALEVVRSVLGEAAIAGAYLYGSAVQGGVRPDSDVDLLVVTERSLALAEKRAVTTGLLPISGAATRPPDWRPIELTAVARAEVATWRYPPRMELQYGEWLRRELEAGQIEPGPVENADLAILLSMARDHARPLVGPMAAEVIAEVPSTAVVRATLDSLPDLLADLEDDTRNVLLTLARMWATLATGAMMSKDAAADWAIGRLGQRHATLLARARDLYRDGGWGDWDDLTAVRDCVGVMAAEIREAPRQGLSGA